jgi:transposase
MENEKNTKIKVLRKHGSLNPKPQKVTDELFVTNEFFDPRDIIQVKYEMLRRVRVEGQSVTHVAAKFGFSRVAFYQIQKAYEEGGLPALIPKHRGPKHAHKLTDTILSFINKHRTNDKTLRPPALSEMVQKQFGFPIHPRSIERALLRQQKKGR